MDTYAHFSWKPIPCCHQHGVIGYYLILYDYVLPNGTLVEDRIKTVGNVLEYYVMDFLPNTEYVVRVAGVNRAGQGVSSLPLPLITDGGKKMGLFTQSPCCVIDAVSFCTL